MLTVQRILTPVDFSSFSERALEYAHDLANELGAELHLIYVREELHYIFPDGDMPSAQSGEFLAHQTEIAAARLEALASATASQQLTVVREVLSGTPHVEILKYADNKSIDMIVMGTHGRGGLMHLLIGSVAERVVQRAHCPVLTVRGRDPQTKPT